MNIARGKAMQCGHLGRVWGGLDDDETFACR